MIQKVTIIILSLLTILLILNCGSVPPTYYYRIHYDLPHYNSPTPLPMTIGIEQFDSDILYKGDQIVYRNSEYEVQFYHYRRWIAPPNKIVSESTLEQFKSSGIFKNVVKYPSTSNVDYILTGKIKAFEEWDENNTWYGLVSIAFELHDKENHRTIWQNIFTEKTDALKKEPKEVVKAISESLKKVVEKAIQEVGQILH